MLLPVILSIASVLSQSGAYKLVDSYDSTNFFQSFNFHDEADPTKGFVDYVNVDIARELGYARILGDQVYLGVNNQSVLPSTTGAGRQSLWLTSKTPFLHGLLIGDFAHIPANECGTWPAFWTISENKGPYGEIDIFEGYNNIDTAYTTLHTNPNTLGACTFTPPATAELGVSNQKSYDCGSGIGCSVIGPAAGYGTKFNANGGGVYALEWTSSVINVFFFPRNAIPADIKAGTPNPAGWGVPTANFESAYGHCDIDANFLSQTISFDTDFCGTEAGGQGWSAWSTCPKTTGYSTCEAYVAAKPAAFDESYWLINSVKVYQ